MNDSNFLKEIGRSYIVSAFIPAAIFVLLGYFLFRGFIPDRFVSLLSKNAVFTNYQWVILFLITLWVAFYLFSADDITVRFFEGYLLPSRLQSLMKNRHREIWEKEYKKYEDWKNLNDDFQKRKENGDVFDNEEVAELAGRLLQAKSTLANLGIRYPLDRTQIMPTRLGNVLRASETYAYERYNIAEVTIWPRLAPFIPLQITRNFEEKNNHFMFLINSAFLAMLNGLGGIGFGLLGIFVGIASRFGNNQITGLAGFFYIGYDFVPFWAYFMISIALFGFSYILYLIASNVAEEFGMYVRTSYDLYRIELLRQFHWRPPRSLEEEKHIWDNLSRFIIGADRFGKLELPEFEYPENEKSEPAAQILRLKDDKAKWPGR